MSFNIETLLNSIESNTWFRVYNLNVEYSVTDINIRLRKIKEFRERKVKFGTRFFTEFFISTEDLFIIKLEAEKYQTTTPLKISDLPIRESKADKFLYKILKC